MDGVKAFQLICGSVLGLFVLLVSFALFGIGPTLTVAYTLLIVGGIYAYRRLRGTWWTRPIGKRD